MREEAIRLTKRALPVYTLLPCLCFACEHFDLFATQLRVSNVIAYVMTVELLVFLDHYYVLHKWRHLRHSTHHHFRTKADVTAWVAYAFHPIDGLSQGMPILYAALLVPVPSYVVRLMIAIVGVWTILIHTAGVDLPYPLMGSKYHLIHHERNWYNFGLFTVACDTLWRTVKHP